MTLKKLFSAILGTVFLFSTCMAAIPLTASASPLSSEAGYGNVARGKSYTKDTISSSYPDENGTSMTDGTAAASTAKFGNSAYMAFDYTAEQTRNGCGSITVDLGSLHKLDKFVAYVAASGNGNGGAGVYAPQLMQVYVSTDNTNWYKAGDKAITDNGNTSMTVSLELSEVVTARYVRFKFYDSKMWKRWIFISEIEAYGVKTDTAIPYPDVEEVKFLFIGNSSTFYFHNPLKFMFIAEDAGINVDLTYCTIGSSYLSDFASTTTVHGKDLRKKLADKKYDYIVVQDNSAADADDSKAAMDVLMPLFEENGGEVVLYERYSSNSDASLRVASAYKHHGNYSRLSSQYGIDEIAHVADAFLIATNLYPEINLHHTDNSHHNEISSYLIALVWAKAFLGIDVTKTQYNSTLDAATANKLKNVANIACNEGYPFNELCYTENGVTYRNVAAYKNYTSDGTRYAGNADWNDFLSDGSIKGKLTDTAIATNGNDHAIGCYNGQTVNFVIDLNGYYNIKAIKADMFGNTSWGIKNPSENSVNVAISTDGTNFTDIGAATRTDGTADAGWTKADFSLITNKDDLVARFVRVTYSNSNGSTPFWTSDIRVFGSASSYVPENPPVDNPPVVTPPVTNGNLAFGKGYTVSGLYSVDGVVSYPDENGKSLTDGSSASPDGTYSDPAFAGFNVQSTEYRENGYASVTVDLEKVYAVDKFIARVGTKKLTSGIIAPSGVSIYVSENNTDWKYAGDVAVEDTDVTNTLDATIQLDKSVAARYVQFRITGEKSWIFVSEVEVYEGAPVTEPDPEPTVMLGDVNDDKKVDSLDYLLVKRACFKTYNLSEEETVRADVNVDSKIDSTDYLLVKRIAFGTYTA
ncbi:MAG: discoidin domain-containing protein [Clostridia bacterium]|nr:discoidin domain-containing protein [Clostridia bacterium]